MTRLRSEEMVHLYRLFDQAVSECRRLEARHGLPLWATYYDKKMKAIIEIPRDRLPGDYVRALESWDAARERVKALALREAQERRTRAKRARTEATS